MTICFVSEVLEDVISHIEGLIKKNRHHHRLFERCPKIVTAMKCCLFTIVVLLLLKNSSLHFVSHRLSNENICGCSVTSNNKHLLHASWIVADPFFRKLFLSGFHSSCFYSFLLFANYRSLLASWAQGCWMRTKDLLWLTVLSFNYNLTGLPLVCNNS